MSKETEVILRAALMSVKGSKSLKQAIKRLEVMCSEDIILAVDKAIKEEQAIVDDEM